MAKNTKTERILAILHLFRRCREVSFKEVTDLIPVSKKTVYRDIRFLREAGFCISYARTSGAFVMCPDKEPALLPENKTRRRYMERVLRLAEMMSGMGRADDPAAWYREKYPNLSTRTRQRDFKILCSIGYRVEYVRGSDDWADREPRKYYCEWPADTYDSDIFDLFRRP